MAKDLEQRVQALEAHLGAMAQGVVETGKAHAQVLNDVNIGFVEVMAGIVEELIAAGAIDRNHLVLVLEKRLEHAEEAGRSPVHRTSLEGLLMLLRTQGEPPRG